MRKFLYVLAAIVAIAVLAVVAIQRQEPPNTLDGLYEEYYQRGHQRGIRSPFSGVVLVARDGEVVFERAYGYTDPDGDRELDLDSKFFVGSNAKPFTALLVLQQVEAGKLDLKANVSGYLPDFPAELGRRITLHHLLSHTSGLPRDENDWEDLELRHEPGSAYRFSNIGYELLVAILETATGESYSELVDAGIVVPLGLAGTGFAGGETIADTVTPGWAFNRHEFPMTMFAPGDGSFSRRRMPRAGAVYSTARDLYRFVQALQANELLSAGLTESMFDPGIDGNAYGWFRNQEQYFLRNPLSQFYAHVGRLGGHNTVVAFYDDGTTAIVMANVDPIGTVDLLTQTYLAAQGKSEIELDVKHPRLRNPGTFRSDGGVDAFFAYYETLSERAGYPIQPSGGFYGQVVRLLARDEAYAEAVTFLDTALEKWPPGSPGTLNDIGYVFLRRDRFEEARRYFERNVELFPRDANAYDSLGEAHEREGNLEAARASYAKAVEVARETGDRSLDFYERRVADVDEQLAGNRPVTP